MECRSFSIRQSEEDEPIRTTCSLLAGLVLIDSDDGACIAAYIAIYAKHSNELDVVGIL